MNLQTCLFSLLWNKSFASDGAQISHQLPNWWKIWFFHKTASVFSYREDGLSTWGVLYAEWLTGILPAWQTGDLRVCAHHWSYRIISFYWEQSPLIWTKAGINNWFQYFTRCKPHIPAWERGVAPPELLGLAECKQTCERWSSQIRTWDLCLPSLFVITGIKSWLRIIKVLFL